MATSSEAQRCLSHPHLTQSSQGLNVMRLSVLPTTALLLAIAGTIVSNVRVDLW